MKIKLRHATGKQIKEAAEKAREYCNSPLIRCGKSCKYYHDCDWIVSTIRLTNLDLDAEIEVKDEQGKENTG